MQIGEPTAAFSGNSDDGSEQQLELQLRLQDIPGPHGLPLSATPWCLMKGTEILQQGKCDADGMIKTGKLKVPKNCRLKFLFPGRTIDLKVQDGSIEELSQEDKMAHLGYNVDPRMMAQSTHRQSEIKIYKKDQKGA